MLRLRTEIALVVVASGCGGLIGTATQDGAEAGQDARAPASNDSAAEAHRDVDGPPDSSTNDVARAPCPSGSLVTLAAGQQNVSAIAIDATNVYWTTSPDPACHCPPVLARVSHSGGPVTTLASSLTLPPAFLSVDATGLYWGCPVGGLVEPAIFRVGTDGGPVTTLWTGSLYGLSATDSELFFVGSPDGALDLELLVIAKTGGPASVVVPAPRGKTLTGRVLATSRDVYWAGESPSSTTIFDVPADGGAVAPFASKQPYPYLLGSDGANVFWVGADQLVAYLVRQPLAGGSPTTIATQPGASALDFTLENIAVGGGYVAWYAAAKGGGAMLFRTPVAGGTTCTLETWDVVPTSVSLAADDTSVYFQNPAGDLQRLVFE